MLALVLLAANGLFCLDEALAVHPVDHMTIMTPSGVERTVQWRPNSEGNQTVTHYMVRVHHFEHCEVVLEVTTGADHMEWTPPRAGHYIISAQACNENGCSDWAESINPEYALWEDEAKSWWIFAYIATPTEGDIE